MTSDNKALSKRVLVQIPCLNEAADIANVLDAIPKTIEGVSEIKIMVIDDASTDDTVAIAEKHGVDLVISKEVTRGLAHSFRLGLSYFLSSGFDVLVNIDGDNQYPQSDIPRLITPILNGSADVVIGDRGTWSLKHFALWKRILQKLGSGVVGFVAKTKVRDAASGFRAYGRVAAASIFIVTNFSYAMESIIQAGNKGLRVESIPSSARRVSRPSRLFSSQLEHVRRSAGAILKGFLMYRPLAAFSALSVPLFLFGSIPMIRYLVLTLSSTAGDHIQSLLLGSLMITSSIIFMVLGLIAELSKIHRRLHEDQVAASRLGGADHFQGVLELHGAKLRVIKK